MDIHKPKPWHGLREFLKEYLIIVVGVLTALAGEQAVETAHRGQELRETREALREEIALNALVVRAGVALDTCRAARLVMLQVWAEGGPKPKPSTASGVSMLAFSAWDVAKAGPLAKMPVAERLKYSALYDAFSAMQGNLQNQVSDGLDLAQFTPLAKLSPDQAQRVLERINRVRATLAVKAINAEKIQGEVRAVGVSPRPMSDAGRQVLDAMCQSAGLPTPKV